MRVLQPLLIAGIILACNIGWGQTPSAQPSTSQPPSEKTTAAVSASPQPPPADPSPPALSQETARPKVGIMRFDLSEGENASIGRFLYDAFMEKMVNSGKVTVVDWEEIDRILKYLATSQPNLSPDEARKQAISQLGISKMYVGSLTKAGKTLKVAVKVLNLDLSLEKMVSESASDEDKLNEAVARVADKLLQSPEELRQKEDEKRAEDEARRKKGTENEHRQKEPDSQFNSGPLRDFGK